MYFSIGFLVVIYFTVSVSGGSGADVVLSCALVEEGGGVGSFGATGERTLFSQTPATLVLRDLPISPETAPETLTPYNHPASPNPDDIIFEVKVTSPEIPEADSLLHADCNELEVTCEISRFFPRGPEEGADIAYFIGSVQLEGGGISLTLVLRTLPHGNEEVDSVATSLIQNKLELPLSKSGTLMTEVAFLVFSRSQSLMAPIGGEVLLDCGFRQQDSAPPESLGLEWRLQHRGKGNRVLEMKTLEIEEGPTVSVEREGSSVDPALVFGDGNVSLSLMKLKVSDEGTYICTVSSGMFQAQQIIQLHIMQPPRVSLSVDSVVFQDELPQKVSCHCEHYYPLDVQVEWLSLSPSMSEPVSLSKEASLSSHRQYSDGTLSLSSHLTLSPSAQPPGTTVTCRVCHLSLATPLSVSLTVSTPEPGQSYWIVGGLLLATVLFFYQLLN